jgi:hypothetical protein
MNAIALLILLALPIASASQAPASAPASVTLTADEARHMLFKLRLAEQAAIQYDLDRAKAIQILREMQQKIKELEERKCL